MNAHPDDAVTPCEEISPRIVCLLAVRNAGSNLKAWLDEAERFADAVVALDDGSTDDTAAVLRSHPLVSVLLTNEQRTGYLGWHDGRNRNRLLAIAADLKPDWIISLDADERLDPTDATALRQFVATEALPGCAYGFQLYQLLGDETFDPHYEWVYRLFRYREGQRFPNRRLDFVPVPTALGPETRVRTTLRIQHYELGATAREARIAKFREADPEGAFRSYYEHLRPLSPGPYPRWAPRVPVTPVLSAAIPSDDASQPVGVATVRHAWRPSVVCLLPARDCAELLSGYFESIAPFADAVVALDDGSIDDTREILRRHPLVVKLLTNESRPGFHNWDDGENRNRLLTAAAEFEPDWIISIDADERVPLEDGVALRRFLRDEARPGYGYGLNSYRMIGDEDHYDRLDYHAYRLFAFETGQVFPTDRLHAPPIPISIPRDEWRMTTIRMKHMTSLTEARRRARWEKFRQADPNCFWEPDYSYTIEPSGVVKPWPARPLDMPAMEVTEPQVDPLAAEAAALDLDGPVLSAVLFVEPGEEQEAVRLLQQLSAAFDARVELLAVTRDAYVAEVLERSPVAVVVINVVPDLRAAAMHNAALQVARGDYVAFMTLGDPLGADELEALLGAHESGNALVRAPIANLSETPAGWADFFLPAGNPCPGDDLLPSTAYISFAREPLLRIGGFDPNATEGFESIAAQELLRLGFAVTTVSNVFRAQSGTPTISALIRRRYELGRSMARSGESGATANPRKLAGLAADVSRGARLGRRQLEREQTVHGGRRTVTAGLIALGATATWLGSARQGVHWRQPNGRRQAN